MALKFCLFLLFRTVSFYESLLCQYYNGVASRFVALSLDLWTIFDLLSEVLHKGVNIYLLSQSSRFPAHSEWKKMERIPIFLEGN